MGSRRTGNGVERVYHAAQRWVDCALRKDGSLFTPGDVIWTVENLEVLHEKFLNSPDDTNRSFLEKLKDQLSGSPAAVFQLMGECLYFYFLIVYTKNGTDEKNVIDTVLQWSDLPVEIPMELVDALTPGIANPGTAYHTFRPFQVGLLIEFTEQLKQEDSDTIERLLDDPWAFKRYLMDFRPHSRLVSMYQNTSRTQRQALLHLVHPDTFEGIVSEDHKNAIADTFYGLVKQPTDDVDLKLQQIRAGLEEILGRNVHFYDDDIRRQWRDGKGLSTNPWDKFISLAKEYVGSGRLEEEEIDYKLEIAQAFEEARHAALEGSADWIDRLSAGLRVANGNPLAWRVTDDFRKWVSKSPTDALGALRAIWVQDDSSIAERVNSFCSLLPASEVSGPGLRTSLASVLLMGLNKEKYPPFLISRFEDAYELTGYALPARDADEAALYAHALGFLDRFIEESKKRNLNLRHRIDAQSVTWAIVTGRVGSPVETDDQIKEIDAITLDDLASQTYLPPWFLQEIRLLLEEKKQVIFQGPPGTGKTYIAQKLAKCLAGSAERVTLVQFHPSYAYEDFVQGFRPKMENGQPGFELRDGPLLRIAEKALNDSNNDYYLIIDEINRGNLAKVLGELYFLLEYRDEPVALQYSDKEFRLPKNLYIIGTMNTADRSIALVDMALRRRFYFKLFHPDEEPVKNVLREWLKATNPDMEWVADVVDRVNEKLKDDRHAAIGPSYFMKDDLDDAAVERIWKHSVLPYIEERRFGGGEGDKQDFDLKKLKREASKGEEGADNADSNEQQ